MKSLAISELRANLMNAIEQVKKGKSIVITSHGKPVAQLVPPEDKKEDAKTSLKALRKTAVIGDVISPTGEIWEAG